MMNKIYTACAAMIIGGCILIGSGIIADAIEGVNITQNQNVKVMPAPMITFDDIKDNRASGAWSEYLTEAGVKYV